MKKILLFFSLAVFSFSLAASAQATVTLRSPNGAEQWNKGDTTKKIVWVYFGATTGSKFNISIFPVSSTGVAGTVRSIVKNVSCATPQTGCEYLWKVGSIVNASVNADYKITVCKVGSTPTSADCDTSNNSFKILPPELTSQQQVLDLFKSAIGNRYNDLNAFDRATSNYYTGEAGVRDFIMANINTVAAPNYRITTTMVNDDTTGAYRKSGKDLLDWFRTKFIDLDRVDNSFLTHRDKSGISYAMVNRYRDLCVNEFNAQVKVLNANYNAKIAATERSKQASIALCNDAYNATVRSINNNTESNSFKKAEQQYIAKELARLTKEECANQAYTKYYNNGFPAVGTTLPATESAFAARTALEAGYTPVQNGYTECLRVVAPLW